MDHHWSQGPFSADSKKISNSSSVSEDNLYIFLMYEYPAEHELRFVSDEAMSSGSVKELHEINRSIPRSISDEVYKTWQIMLGLVLCSGTRWRLRQMANYHQTETCSHPALLHCLQIIAI